MIFTSPSEPFHMVLEGILHINTVEGLWQCLKCLGKNVRGLNFKTLKKIGKKGLNPSNYIDDWVCFYFFLRHIGRKNLNESEAKNFYFKF